MKKLLVLVTGYTILFFPLLAYSQQLDIRITDRDGHTANIAATGELQASTTNEGEGATYPGAIDIRICDPEGHCVNINADGTLPVVSGSPY